jgi:hypothetical protein
MPTVPFYHREQQLAALNRLIRTGGPQDVSLALLGRELGPALLLLDGTAHNAQNVCPG